MVKKNGELFLCYGPEFVIAARRRCLVTSQLCSYLSNEDQNHFQTYSQIYCQNCGKMEDFFCVMVLNLLLRLDAGAS